MDGKTSLGGWIVVAAPLVGVLALSSCGGGGTDAAPGEVLFDGAPHELVPHPAGQIARFRLTAETSEGARMAMITATVLSDKPSGEFVVEQAIDPDEGARLRTRLRESASDIRIEAYALEDAEGSFAWIDLDRPSIVVQTPVVAGEVVETGFFRLVELRVTANGETRTVRAPLRGQAQRTATGWVDTSVGGQVVSAIRFAILAEASLTIPVAGVDVTLRITGEELYAPGIGLVREELDIAASAGDETESARWVVERQP